METVHVTSHHVTPDGPFPPTVTFRTSLNDGVVRTFNTREHGQRVCDELNRKLRSRGL